MEDTQAITWDEEEEDTQQPSYSSGGSSEPVGRLHVFSSNYGPEKDFPLYLGKNVVGRLPDCSVTLPFSSISKQHAVIEILARDRAPLLQDCGSLNGTQILRPTKVLSPGVSHRLRDQQLILFADLPCQYHRLDAPQPSVSRGPLTVEETPRAQGGIQPTRLLLAEDSEEELDSHLKKCVMKDPRSAFSPWATVVPESDEEGLSPAPGGPGPSSSFKLESDTDEEEGQLSAAEETSSAARRSAAIVAKQPNGVAAKQQPAVTETGNDTEVQKNADNRLVPDGVILERNQAPAEESNSDVDDNRLPRRPTVSHVQRAQPSDVMDSDTDVEEEKIPATPAVVPVKKRHGFCGVGPSSPGALGPQESQAGGDADGEESKASLAIPLVGSQAPMVINSDTDEEEEISAALTLARLKESPAAGWNRDRHVEGDRGQPKVLLHQNQSTSERDSDTDMEEEKGVPEGQTVPSGHTNRNGTLYTAHSTMSAPPPGEKDIKVEAEMSSPGIHLQRSQDCTTVVVKTEKEEEVSREPAVGHLQKGQVLGETTNQIKVEAEGDPAKLGCEADAEEGTSLAASVVTDAKKNQIPVKEAADTDYTTARQESAVQLGAQDRSPVAQVEQNFLPVSKKNLTDEVVDTGSPGGTTQSQREGAQTPIGTERELHMGSTKGLEEDSDDFDDLELQATQCFVDRDVQHLEDLNVEDESLLNLPPEPGSSCCSSATMDVSWELMATQPFCTTESDASETQSTATHPEAHGFCLSPPSTVPQEQRAESPEHTELLGSQGRAMQTMEKDMDHLKCNLSRDETSKGDPECPDACRPEALTPLPDPLISQDQQHPAPQPFLPPSPPAFESSIVRTRQNGNQTPESSLSSELEHEVRPQRSSPVFSAALEPHPPTPPEQCDTPKPIPRATMGRSHRSSIKTLELAELTVPDFQPSTSTEQSDIPRPTVRATRGRTHRSSAKTPEPAKPPVPTEQPDTSKPTPRGRACRSSTKTPEPAEPPVPTEQPDTSKPTSQGRARRSSTKTPEPVELPIPTEQPETSKRTSRGRARRSSTKTPEPAELPVPTEQPDSAKPTSRGRTCESSTNTLEPVEPPVPTEQPNTPKPTPRATRGRTRGSSGKALEPADPPVPPEQPDTPKPTAQATRGRTRGSSVKTPEPAKSPVPTEQSDTSKPSSRGRTRGSSVKTPEPAKSLVPTEQPDTSKPSSRGRTRRSSTKTPEQVEPIASDLEPSSTRDQPVTPKAIAQSNQSKTLRSSRSSVVPVSATSEFQSAVTAEQQTLQPIPQGSNSRAQRVTRKQSSPKAPVVHKPCSALPEPKSRPSRNQRQGAVRAAESLGTVPEPSFSQPPGVPTHAPQIQKVEASDISEVAQELPPKVSSSCKRPSSFIDSPPRHKRLRRGQVSPKTVFPREEEEGASEKPRREEDIVVPGPGKRKRGQAEKEPQEVPNRSRRRTKPLEPSAAPKVLFTGVLDPRGEQTVLALGGSLASSVAEASHLVTDRICRTVKFLCALGRGIPILSLDWLHQSRKAGCFLPPDEYVVTDPEQEKNYGFRLRDALSRARERRLLEGYEIHVTPGVQPPPPQMGEIISCCGGTVLPNMPRSYKPHRVVITCHQDFSRCSGPLRLGLPVLSPEFLLTGVLKQEATPEAFVFSTLEMPST